MKKILLFLVIFLLFAGCINQKTETQKKIYYPDIIIIDYPKVVYSDELKNGINVKLKLVGPLEEKVRAKVCTSLSETYFENICVDVVKESGKTEKEFDIKIRGKNVETLKFFYLTFNICYNFTEIYEAEGCLKKGKTCLFSIKNKGKYIIVKDIKFHNNTLSFYLNPINKDYYFLKNLNRCSFSDASLEGKITVYINLAGLYKNKIVVKAERGSKIPLHFKINDLEEKEKASLLIKLNYNIITKKRYMGVIKIYK